MGSNIHGLSKVTGNNGQSGCESTLLLLVISDGEWFERRMVTARRSLEVARMRTGIIAT